MTTCKTIFLCGSTTTFLPEIRVSGLTHGDLMFTGQKQDLVVGFQLIDVADVLAVDPKLRMFYPPWSFRPIAVPPTPGFERGRERD